MPGITKYIFVTGGVVSSLGKGIVSSSLAKLLQARGYSVTIQKFDPYINIDPGTLNPYEHGEVYVTDDGAETDLDLGHYERFLDISMGKANNVTTGRIYQKVIKNERAGEYGGKTVQVVPHVTDEIKRRILKLGKDDRYQIVITEIGGTVGDIESLPYFEAVRQLHYELGAYDTLFIHLTLVPYLAAAGELKTKPTQHSVKQLLELGVQPDILVCRTEHPLGKDIRSKIARFCNLAMNAVIESRDARSIYEVPLLLKRQQLDKVVLTKLKLPQGKEPELSEWEAFLANEANPKHEVTLGLIGKYVELGDAYKSISEAFVHGGAVHQTRVTVKKIHSEDINEENAERVLKDIDGLLIAPGFGERGVQGKILAAKYARENKIPFLGICLGMQMACIEYGRNVLKLPDCYSAEFKPKTKNPVIDLMEDQKNVTQMGGTMRLGKYDCTIKKNTLAYRIYKKTNISERHRHRFEFNNTYLEQFEKAGMVASGINEKNKLVEIVEITSHPFFIASQFHPEYKSTVLHPHPLFVAFIKAMMIYKGETSTSKLA